MEEKWKDIEGYESKYKVSNRGFVKSFAQNNPKILSNKTDKFGYKCVKLYKNGTPKQYKVHRLVAKTFIPNPENKYTVNHKNGVKSDNNVNNLEWMSLASNIKHAYRNGLCKNSTRRGSDSHYAKLEEADVLEIKELLKTSLTQKEISKIYGVTHQSISLINLGKTWRHL